MDLTAIVVAVITGLGGAAAAFLGAYYLFRGKKVEAETEEAKVESTATEAFLNGQTAFQEYVDKVVEKRVEAAVAELQRQLTEFGEEMATMRRESHEMNEAIRGRETQLWLWNIRNRLGPIPELPFAILKKLGITHLSSFSEEDEIDVTQPIHPTT